jgi:glycosyltransferase involved in cell wall biosynthesis
MPRFEYSHAWDIASRLDRRSDWHGGQNPIGRTENKPRIAFVQDALPFLGGAERLLSQALKVNPGAHLYTLVFNPSHFRETPIGGTNVHTSFIDRLPGAHRNHRIFLPLFPLAVESLDLSAYDLVVTFSYAAAHGVLTRPDQAHIALFYRPLRQAYGEFGQTPSGGGLRRFALQALLRIFRKWDQVACSRPDRILAVSAWVAGLLWQAYHRPAQVIYPPVEIERFHPAPDRQDYFICVSRMEAHKKLALVVEAFNRLGLPLLLVGEGRQKVRLQKMARSNIRFLHHQTDGEVADLLSRARAFVQAGVEDFGIALVEAQAAGCPVIAYQGGGASETVTHECTGILFPEQSPEHLIEAVLAFESSRDRFSPQELRTSAARFSAQRFRSEFATLIQSALGDHSSLKVSHERLKIPAQAAFQPLD